MMLYYRGRQRILDANGDPVSGAKLNFYLTGTTTRADTYQDSDLTVAHANPVIAASNGFVAPIYLDPAVNYKCVITTSADVALPDGTVDPVSATLDSETIGISLYPRTSAEIAASVTPDDYTFPFGDVRRYGAIGDGATNDATAFANALLACSGEAITLQPGFTYKINSALTIGANTAIFGYGAALDFSSAGNITCLTLGSGVKLYGFTITGPGNASYNASSILISCAGTDNTPSAPTYVTGPQLIDLTITECGNYGVFLKYINQGAIRGCKITEIGYAGIGGLSCNRLNVEHNYIGQITPGSSSNCYGVFIDRSEGTLTADPYSNFCRIVGNTIEDIPIWEAIDTHAGQNFVIADNIISNCKRGIAVTDSDVSNVPTYAPVNVVISGNCISGLSTGSAILVNGAYDSGSTVDYAENISIIGNTITSGGLAGDDTEGCIKVRSTKNLVISGNTLRQPIAAGISLYFDNLSCNITGNVIVDPNDATDDSSCIAVGGINNKGTVSGNTFVCENTGLATKVAERAVYAASAYAGMDLRIGENARIGAAAARLVMSSFARAYTAADTTPSVANTDFLVISNSGAVTITAFDDGYEGQLLTLWFADSNTTIDRTSCYLSGGVNFTGTGSDTLTLKKYQSGWYEVARGVNS